MSHGKRGSSSNYEKSSKKPRRGDHGDDDSDRDETDYSQYASMRHGKGVITVDDDYFSKATEFQTWLRLDKKKFFDDLSSRSAREYFAKFAKRWNKGKLEKRYYDGIASSDVPAAERTGYKWKFKNLNEAELVSAQDSVHAMTQSKEHLARPLSRDEMKRRAASDNTTTRPKTALERDEELDREQSSRFAKRKEARDSRKHHEMVLDELVPKATGREAQLEKKRAYTAYHRQERDLDVEVNDSDLMGPGSTGDSSLAAAKRVQDRRDQRRNAVRDEKALAMSGKVAAYQQKEDQTLAMLKQMAESRFGGGGGG
ncbi:hypothetical protein HDU87_004452 [Geranomyces variabilis]|uniref:Uncharacterized protein n=1 Tax=Geranomyces variabilis TaxID=109894 RepID=A0AAD5XRX1_9FUNG|nr:hypothetical protein HDU87_004452 [Geranomyces variabilis]